MRRLEWVAPTASRQPSNALLAAEDKRFFEHSGVDWRAFVGSLWHNLWYDRKRGASTLSMQLAGLLDPELALGRGGLPPRSLGQKWDQALAAQALEARWTKGRSSRPTSTWRPSGATCRGPCRGAGPVRQVAGRARAGRGPDPGGAAAGPNARPSMSPSGPACWPSASTRRPPAARPSASPPASTASTRPALGLAPHAGRLLLASRQPGERLAQHPDAELQRAWPARSSASAWRRRRALVDNASGEVLAYVGRPTRPSPTRPAAAQRRQPAAALAYGVAIERRQITAATRSRIPSATTPDPPRRAACGSAPAPRWPTAWPSPAQTVTRLAAMPCRAPAPGRHRVARSGLPGPQPAAAGRLYRALASGGQWLARTCTPAPGGPSAACCGPRPGSSWRHPGPARCGRHAQPFLFRQSLPDGRETVLAVLLDRHAGPVGGGRRGLRRPGGGRWGRRSCAGCTATRPGALHPPPGVVSALVVFEPTGRERPARVVHPRHRDRAGQRAARNPPRILYPVGGGIVDATGAGGQTAVSGSFRGRRAPPGGWWRLDGERLAAANGRSETATMEQWRQPAWRPVEGAICSS